MIEDIIKNPNSGLIDYSTKVVTEFKEWAKSIDGIDQPYKRGNQKILHFQMFSRER